MASNNNIDISSTVGYDVMVIGEHPPQLHCGICTLLIKNAMHGCINHAFCKSCIEKHIECGIKIGGNVMCPGGCNQIINPEKLEPNKFADRMVNTLTTKCMNDNCLWQGDLLDLVQVHQINCDYILQSCINNGCNDKYIRKDVINHDEVCLYKLIQCTYCQNHVIRMNKEKHEIECLDEEVNCIYYEIGCEKKFCRKDIQSHDQIHQANHMKLIYKNLVDCKQELLITNDKVTVLTQENTIMKQESVTIKQKNVKIKQDIITIKVENVTLKEECCSLGKEVDELKMKSNKEVAQLKQEINTMTTEFQEFKNDNINLKEIVNVATSEIVDEKQMQVKVVNDIERLKETLEASVLSEKVSLLNNDKVLKVNFNSKIVNYSIFMKKVSECYKNNQFDFIINHCDMVDHRNLMKELLSQLPYHLLEFQTMYYHIYSTLVFPLDFNNIQNFEVTIPNGFKVKIVNNEITIELLNFVSGTSIYLYIGKYYKCLQHQQKFNLQQLNGCTEWEFEFAHGYALLRI